MAVSSAEKAAAVTDLTDKDDVMHVVEERVIEEIVTLPSCSLTISALSNYEREDEQVVLDRTSHEEHEKVKDTAIGKQDVTSIQLFLRNPTSPDISIFYATYVLLIKHFLNTYMQ